MTSVEGTRVGPGVARFADQMDALLLPLVVALGALGMALPEPGQALDRAGGIDPTLAVLVFATGLSVSTASLVTACPRWPRLALALVASAIALPTLAWAVSNLVWGPFRDGVLAVGVAPAEVASVALVGLAGGEVAVAAVLLVASTLITVVLAGPVLGLMAGVPTLHPAGLLFNLGLVVGLPLVAGGGLRQISHPGERGLGLGRLAGSAALLVLLWEVASQVHLRPAYGMVTLALVAFLAGATGLGWLLARGLPGSTHSAILLPVAMRDFAVAAGIASAAFGGASTGPLGIYGLLVLLFGTASARLARARSSRGLGAVKR